MTNITTAPREPEPPACAQKLTLRQLSERVRDHLIQQDAKSMEGTSCAYRGEGGAMCAVGCLIDDENYVPSLEGDSAQTTGVAAAVENSLGFKLKLNAHQLLARWQSYHDGTMDGAGYGEWLAGAKHASPDIFHDARMQDLIDVEVDPDSTAAVPGGAA